MRREAGGVDADAGAARRRGDAVEVDDRAPHMVLAALEHVPYLRVSAGPLQAETAIVHQVGGGVCRSERDALPVDVRHLKVIRLGARFHAQRLAVHHSQCLPDNGGDRKR